MAWEVILWLVSVVLGTLGLSWYAGNSAKRGRRIEEGYKKEQEEFQKLQKEIDARIKEVGQQLKSRKKKHTDPTTFWTNYSKGRKNEND